MFIQSVRKYPENREALDPLAGEDGSTFGRPTIVQAHRNPDLLPNPNPEQRDRVGEAARRSNELRDGLLNSPGLDSAGLENRTLKNLCNQRPTWLASAHADLGAVVVALGRLLDLNVGRAVTEGACGSRQASGVVQPHTP